jgi:hypothetical protein
LVRGITIPPSFGPGSRVCYTDEPVGQRSGAF